METEWRRWGKAHDHTHTHTHTGGAMTKQLTIASNQRAQSVHVCGVKCVPTSETHSSAYPQQPFWVELAPDRFVMLSVVNTCQLTSHIQHDSTRTLQCTLLSTPTKKKRKHTGEDIVSLAHSHRCGQSWRSTTAFHVTRLEPLFRKNSRQTNSYHLTLKMHQILSWQTDPA